MTMPKKAARAAVKTEGSERRSLPRKRALMDAVVVDLKGSNAVDCVIRDINARSAQITFSNDLPVGTQLYLLDTANKAAYQARVVWRRFDRAGLYFVQRHLLNWWLPARLKFLWRLFLEAKTREVYRLVTAGIPLELALSTAGMTRDQLNHMAQYGRSEKRFEILFRIARHGRKRLPRRTFRHHEQRKVRA
jgi:hypothetical protein